MDHTVSARDYRKASSAIEEFLNSNGYKKLLADISNVNFRKDVAEAIKGGGDLLPHLAEVYYLRSEFMELRSIVNTLVAVIMDDCEEDDSDIDAYAPMDYYN